MVVDMVGPTFLLPYDGGPPVVVVSWEEVIADTR